VLSATHRDLQEWVAAGKFREDLLYRVNVVNITVPPLRRRVEDIRPLADRFIAQACATHQRAVGGVEASFYEALERYDWPGNVRQLRNVVESMVVVDYDGVLDLDDLPPELSGTEEAPSDAPPTSLAGMVGKPLEDLERLFIAETLRFAGGNREEAAKLLGIGERTLYRKIKEYQL
jgi:two-component system response regulator HydG